MQHRAARLLLRQFNLHGICVVGGSAFEGQCQLAHFQVEGDQVVVFAGHGVGVRLENDALRVKALSFAGWLVADN